MFWNTILRKYRQNEEIFNINAHSKFARFNKIVNKAKIDFSFYLMKVLTANVNRLGTIWKDYGENVRGTTYMPAGGSELPKKHPTMPVHRSLMIKQIIKYTTGLTDNNINEPAEWFISNFHKKTLHSDKNTRACEKNVFFFCYALFAIVQIQIENSCFRLPPPLATTLRFSSRCAVCFMEAFVCIETKIDIPV